MIALGDMATARATFELGCGTGRLAERLLAETLSPDATYLATDVSPRMTGIAGERMKNWSERANVITLVPGEERLPGGSGMFDRFVATYVFDLLGPDDARRQLSEASRVLTDDGRLCLVGITPASRGMSRLTMGAWGRIAAWFPRATGGCRPIDARRLLDLDLWDVLAEATVTRWSVSSQIVIARPSQSRRSGGVATKPA